MDVLTSSAYFLDRGFCAIIPCWLAHACSTRGKCTPAAAFDLCPAVQHSSVTKLVMAMKKSLQEQQNEGKQMDEARRNQMAIQAQRQQQYGGYPQMPPPSGGYQGHYGAHMGYAGSQAGFVGNRGY